MFLTKEEMIELTGYKNRPGQIRWLSERGYKFEIARDGRPRVLKAAIIKALGSYRQILDKHVLPVFAAKPVNEINRLDVKSFLMKKVSGGLAASSVQHIKNVISNVLNIAVDDTAIQVNPAHRLGKVFREKGLRLEIDPLNRQEIALLLES